MRVLLISHTCQSRTAGQPKADRLAEIPDIELDVVVPDRWREYGAWRGVDTPDPASRARYHVLRPSWPWAGPAQWYLHWYPSLGKLIRKVQPDVIDLWEEPWGLVSAQTVWLAGRYLPNARIISETEQNIEKRLPLPFESFRRYTLRRADFVIGRSAEALEILKRKGYRGDGRTVPNGVDSALFTPLDQAACRRKYGVEKFTAGYVGRLVPEKGLMDLVEALPRCGTGVDALFAGDGPFKPELETRARELGVAERVRFLSARPAQELPEVMNALDVLVLPSRTTASWKEQFGRVLTEAMACEVPVIGSDSGAIPDVIGEAGIIFEEGNAMGLAAAIGSLMGDPGEARRLGAAGRERVLGWCSWEQVAGQMAEVYRKVLAEKGIGVTAAI